MRVISPRPTSVTSTSTSSFFGRSFLRNGTERQRGGDNPATKGPLGLTTLHAPKKNVVANLIFVHGLNGGSESTWRKGSDPSLFWPGEWLPRDDAFQDVRIHTFGYSSSITRESVLDISDFSRSLLAAIQDSPSIPRGENAPLFLVGHSMGGLVIKQAIVLGHQTEEFRPLVQRVGAVFFLATPHQGADLAQTLARILAMSPGTRPRAFVGDLQPHSPFLRSINKAFPRHCETLKLFSFFESRPMNYGIGKGLVVEKECAVMNYPTERRTHLDADHRNVARFSSTRDPTYITIRNALAAAIQDLKSAEWRMPVPTGDAVGRRSIHNFLGKVEAPQDDLISQDTRRLPGSCEWLLKRENFQVWQNHNVSSPKILWLQGRPGVGKSMLAGHVTNHLRSQGLDYCFYFFSSRNKEKSSLVRFLRCMAFQMSLLHPEIEGAIGGLISATKKDVHVTSGLDDSSIWRKLYLSCILKVPLKRPQYWVLDAMDECFDGTDMMAILVKIQESWPLKIFMTSRPSFDAFHEVVDATGGALMATCTVSDKDNCGDILRFLQAHTDSLPGRTAKDREAMAEQMLERSQGCFLWASLMVKELRRVHTEIETARVLANTPADMDELYVNILQGMSRRSTGKDLSRAILIWTTCSFRPLYLEELRTAIEADMADNIDDMRRSIEEYCGDLVYVDGSGRVQLIHATIREFLTSKTNQFELKFDESEGHRRVSIACAKFLIRTVANTSMIGSRAAKVTPSLPLDYENRCFTAYASEFLFKHVAGVSDFDEQLLSTLSRFFASASVLTWIEYCAATAKLHIVLEAAEVLSLLMGRAHDSLTTQEPEVVNLAAWSNDLSYLVRTFSRRLYASPSSMRHLIPPLCPADSAIRRQFSSPRHGPIIQGLKSSGWEECQATTTFSKESWPLCAASGDGYFAIGTASGTVTLYDEMVFGERASLANGQPVWNMEFSDSGTLLATSSARLVKVWNTATGELLFSYPIKALCFAMTFSGGDKCLLVACKDNRLLYLDVKTGNLCTDREPEITWTRDVEDEGSDFKFRQPTMGAFCPHQNLLAIVYRGEDILLWDFENDMLHDIYEKETGSRSHGSIKVADGATTVRELAFSAGEGTPYLAATYLDGDLVLYDVEHGSVVASEEGANAMTLGSSADGRTLAGANSAGDIMLFNFETLQLVRRIRFEGDTILPKALVFTHLKSHLVDVRPNLFRIWQPSALLLSGTRIEDARDDTTAPSGPPAQVQDYVARDQPRITAMHLAKYASVVFCGREDGTVLAYDVSGDPKPQELFVQTPNCSITAIHFDATQGILTCADVAKRVTSRRVERRPRNTCQVGDILLAVSANSYPATQVLASGKEERLLVSTHDCATLWHLDAAEDGSEVAKVTLGSNSRWVVDDTHDDHVLLVDGAQVHIHRWKTFERVRSVVIPGHEPTFASLQRVVLLNSPRHFATVCVPDKSAGQGSTALHLWDPAAFLSSHETEMQLHDLSNIASTVEAAIGIYSDRLVYLDRDYYWVCSVDLLAERCEPVRHFFLPDNWISAMEEAMMDIGRTGDIILVKHGELVVIRRGLEITESGERFNPRRRNPGPRPEKSKEAIHKLSM